MFGNFISLFTVIFGFFAILTGNGTTESEMIGWLLAIGIFFYLNYPGVQQHFVESERARLTPEQLAAMDQVAKANAAAAAAMATPAPAPPAAAAAAPPPPRPPAPAAGGGPNRGSQAPAPRAAGRRSPTRPASPATSEHPGGHRPMTDNKTQSDEPVVAAVGAVVDDNGVVAEGGIAVQGNQALLVARFADMDAASVAYEALRDAEAKRAIDIQGVLVVDADYQGKIKVRKLTDHHTRTGTAWGAVAGVALAIIFPPSLLAGAVAGGVVGAAIGKAGNIKTKSELAKELADVITPGTSGIVAVVAITAIDAVKQTIPDAAEVKTVPVDDETAAAVKSAADAASKEAAPAG